MREILFRGKGTHGFAKGKWVYGYYLKDFLGKNRKGFGIHLIEGGYSKVDPETVGQYTGLTDKNGKKIFEGDIVKCKDYLEAKPFEFQGYIDFKNGSFVIVGDFMTHYRWLDYEVKVIGNIHDNPELLEGG